MLKIFIKNITVCLHRKQDYIVCTTDQHCLWEEVNTMHHNNLIGRWVINVPIDYFKLFLKTLHCMSPSPSWELILLIDNNLQPKKFIKKNFKIIKSAGGVVTKGNAVLFMQRFTKWDLPKGKIEKNEHKKIAAVREVQEECQVEAKIQDKICTTWHSLYRKKILLKKTKWYAMQCIDDTNMQPQFKEGITKVLWISKTSLHHLLKKTYPSIAYIIHSHKKLFK